MSKEEENTAKQTELCNWQKYKVYSIVPLDSVENKPIDTKWVLTRKIQDDKPYIKARLVIKGFQDEEKDIPVCEYPCAHRETIKIILGVISILKFRCLAQL